MTVPTERTTGGQRVRGTQSWVIKAGQRDAAVRSALARATTERARRRRSYATIDPSQVAVRSLGQAAD
ncbi:hypothetical protein ACIPUC_01510 [Streptomyces sp. LARHCF249]